MPINYLYYQDLSENVTTLPVTTDSSILQVIYSIQIPIIKVRDLLTVTSTFEVTNPYSYSVMIGSYIILGSSATDVNGSVLIDRANAFNIAPDMHHGVVTHARQFQSVADYFNLYMNVVGYAASVNAQSGQALTVEQVYGHLDVVII